MKPNKDNLLLKDPDIKPTDQIINSALGNTLFAVYQDVTKVFTEEFDLESQWRYYKDGNAWLCKVVFKKKTILWLSLWEDYIKIGFYFSEKTKDGVLELAITDSVKETFQSAKLIGKLLPLEMDIKHKSQVDDLKTLISYKKGLK